MDGKCVGHGKEDKKGAVDLNDSVTPKRGQSDDPIASSKSSKHFSMKSAEAASMLEQFLRCGTPVAGMAGPNPPILISPGGGGVGGGGGGGHQMPYNPSAFYDYTKNFCYNMMSPGQEQMLASMNSVFTPVPPETNMASDIYWHYNPGPELFSRKVFVGGLPIDIDEDEIQSTFSRFGPLVVDWPRKNENRIFYPPKGYVFLIYEHEPSVQALVAQCHKEKDDKYYICISSPTMRDKPCQVRPWRLADGDFVVDASLPLDPRKTVFIGGVPRPLKAVELATVMDRLYGGVCYAGIDTDPELKYPKGAGRVSFTNQQSFIAAITGRFVQLQHIEMDKRVEVRPYVLDDQMCDECQGQRCGGKYAPYFCAHVSCLQYYCESCWPIIHMRADRQDHKPLVKETVSDKPLSPVRPPVHSSKWSPGRHRKQHNM